jgi:hypothetical protein
MTIILVLMLVAASSPSGAQEISPPVLQAVPVPGETPEISPEQSSAPALSTEISPPLSSQASDEEGPPVIIDKAPAESNDALLRIPSFSRDDKEIGSSAYPPALSPSLMFGENMGFAPDATPEEKAKIHQEMMDAYFRKWKVSLTPYWFFFGADIDMQVGDKATSSAISPGEISSMLSGGFNARLDVNRGHWGGFLDVSDLQFSKQNSSRLAATTVGMESLINHYCVYYRFKGFPVFDIYGGARSFVFNTTITMQPVFSLGRFNGRSIASSTSWTDPIIGARMTAPLSKNFFATIGADAGGFSGDHNSASAYFLLSWEINRTIMLNGGYQMMNFNLNKSAMTGDAMSVNARLKGPALSIGINF